MFDVERGGGRVEGVDGTTSTTSTGTWNSDTGVLAGVYERAVARSGASVEMPNNRKRKKKSGSRSRETRDLKRSVWRAGMD